MDNQQIIAPFRAPSGGGVVHVKVRHTSHFTVIGNHLAQHHELSLIAIGLATHIQSLPAGAKVGIKFLVERFPESEARIAGALRELESHGYLQRTRERLPSGRVVTRTTSFNQPPCAATRTAPVAESEAMWAPSTPERAPKPAHIALNSPPPSPTPPKRKAPPLPRPKTPSPELDRTASALLLDLNGRAIAFDLSEDDVRTLTPAVAAWLEREATPAAIRRALTGELPELMKYPVKFLGHRLTELLPPPLPPAGRPPLYDPMQNCDGCDRAFRAPEPGNCAECRWELAATS
ncbi:helix-turn-helix domain-containing protein [Streptomyces sp. NBC_01022]|uniref:helix-turn-helix domain-containing protein n=1 Tax=Streptomyces sp. NBC_01022 TaxID=2903723 RepID=UPI002DDB55EC|nr:helix-turn-helix domain-containing protein [Streptomyces sp. NBC_01022]WRZ83792.1 helix-turn-helix domain-containing protein [Streptomyces sp. NBC_01022]